MTTATNTATASLRRRRGTAVTARTLGRGAIVLACAALIAAVAGKGAAVHLARSDPKAAALLAPYDARAAVAAAQAGSQSGAKVSTPEVRRLTRMALARDATLSPAIEFRALQAEADADPRREARLFELSSAISRRSLPTRLWLIQREVDRGDVAGALENFDIALRTSTAAPDVLFPVLARAATDPSLSEPIARILDRPEDWRLAFLHYAITEAHAGLGLAGVVLHMRDRHLIAAEHVDDSLVGELVAERQFALARTVHDAFGPSSGQDLVADPRFADPRIRYPFGWVLIQTGTSGASRTRVDGRPALEYDSSPGGGGAVATQLLTLPPGDYRLTVTTAKPTDDPVSQPFWTLSCGGEGGAQLGLVDQPGAAGASASADITVPDGCGGQWLALTVRGNDQPSLTGSVRSVEVVRR